MKNNTNQGQPAGKLTVFVGHRRLYRGAVREAVLAAKGAVDDGAEERVALYEDATGQVVDVDYRGSAEQVLARLADHPVLGQHVEKAGAADGSTSKRGPGRPRLGVVSREVSLLPRHWEWLAGQKGGASAALRRLVDQARKASAPDDRARRAQDAAHRFMWDIAGNLPDFEEASRALYAGDRTALSEKTAGWPEDVRAHIAQLLGDPP